jgi:Magnesium chelatase, subunit ChlI
MALAEAIETTRLHSVAGRTAERTAVVTTRPFRAPHDRSPCHGCSTTGPPRSLRCCTSAASVSMLTSDPRITSSAHVSTGGLAR